MSFWTSLYYTRPTAPPAITGDDLARFLLAFDGLSVTRDRALRSLQVKFGKSIDHDKKPTSWIEWNPSLPEIGTTASIEWDLDHHGSLSLVDAAGLVTGRAHRVYRAFVDLGGACESICNALRVDAPENTAGLHVGGWALECGVIEASHMGDGTEFQVGWIAVSLSGGGYCFPKPRREVLRDAARHPDVQRVMELCRRTWPVAPARPGWSVRRQRKRMGELWPHDSFDEPMDWFWTMHETG